MTFESFMALAERFGVPAALLVVLCVALALVGRYFARRVAEPLVGGHLEYLRTTGESTKQLSAAVEKLAAGEDRQSATLALIAGKLDDHGKFDGRLTAVGDKILGAVAEVKDLVKSEAKDGRHDARGAMDGVVGRIEKTVPALVAAEMAKQPAKARANNDAEQDGA
jgi:hypothetical protein